MKRAAAVGLLLLAPSCKLGPDFERPEMDLPVEFREPVVSGKSVANLPWWELFDDPVLTALVETSLTENRDLEIALSRIDEAASILGFTRTDQLPSLEVSGGAGRAGNSENTLFGPGLTLNNYTLSADLSFEVDLWGRLRRSTEAARAELLATEAAAHAVTLSLVAEVASSYLLLRDLDNQLVISQRTVQTRRDALEILRRRFEEGIIDMLDVHQAEIQLAIAEVSVQQSERNVVQTENALRVLLGRAPGDIPRGRPLSEIVPPTTPTGLPAALLSRRPDVLAAEQRAAAQTARIGVAEALRLPQISLTGSLGLESMELNDFLEADSRFWSVGAGLFGPLFQFGRNLRRVEIEAARARQAVLDYEQTVLIALAEVEDALVARRTFDLEHAARERHVEAARGANFLVRELYDEEYTTYIEVLEADRSLLSAELSESAARRSELQAVVQLYKALGGGWGIERGGASQPTEE